MGVEVTGGERGDCGPRREMVRFGSFVSDSKESTRLRRSSARTRRVSASGKREMNDITK